MDVPELSRPANDVYRPLDSGKQEFRLLAVPSGPGLDLIHARLEVASFNDQPVY